MDHHEHHNLDPDTLSHEGRADVRCAICRRHHTEDPTHLSYGIRLSLCPRHSSPAYLCAEGGLRFVRTLTALWNAHGALTRTRTRALIAHLRMIRQAVHPTPRPGSYAYRRERTEAEQRLARGDSLTQVIADIRDPKRWGGHTPPSERTIRRWYQERRWLKPPIVETLRKLTAPIIDALEVLAHVGTSANFANWITLTNATPPALKRIHNIRDTSPYPRR